VPLNLVLQYAALARSLTSLLDQGKTEDLALVQERIRQGDIIEWLHEQYPGEIERWLDDDRVAWEEVRESVNDLLAVNSARKFGVSKNGLALLLAFCIDAMQQLVPPTDSPPSDAG